MFKVYYNFHKRQKRNEERQLQTKLIGDVRVLVKDPDFREKDKQKSSTVWPTTLPPRILQDRFAIQANLGPEIQPTKAFKTDYTTFTYFITSLLAPGVTTTSTDIIISSNVITEDEPISPTASWDLQKDSPFTQTTSLISGQNEEIKYLSLGSNIYGKIKTLFATYTYTTTNLQGNVGPSTRIITQYSTSLFSDSNVYKTTQIQLNPDQLTSLKLSYIKNQNNYPAETFLLESGQINNVGSGVQFIGNDGQIISNGIISSGSSQTGGSGSEGSGNVSSNNGGGNSSQIIGDSSNSGGSVSSNNNGVYYEINVQQGAQLSGQAEGNKDEHTGQGGSLGTFSSSNNGSGYYETSNQQQGNEQSSGHYGSGSIEGSSGASSSSNGVSNQQQGNKPSSDQYGSGSNGGSSGASSFVNDGSSQHQGNEQSSGQYGSGSSAGSSESSAPNDGGNGYYETINQQQGNEQSSGQYGSGSNGGNAASLSSTNGYYETNNQQQGHGQYGSGSIGGGSIASFSTNGGSGHYEPSNQHQVNGQYEGGLSGQSVTFSVRPGQNHDYKDGTSVYKETYVPSHTVVLGSHYETHTDTSFITTKPIKSSSSGIYLNSNYLISLKKSFLSSSSSSATESKSPIWDINIPTEGPTIIIKPSTVTITETQSAPPASVSPPVIDSGSGSSSSDATSTTPYPPSGGGGVINAVVGGIAEGLGGVFGGGNNNVGGLKVDLGPVLDAVATLLRGPIRSAIANRRSDVEDFSTSREFQNIPRHTQVFVSELTTIPFAQRNIQARNNKYEFVPLPLEKGGSRSDGDLPRSEDSPELHVPQNIYDEINKHRASKDEPVYLDKDKLIINDHVIHTNDPYIIDVLNRFEQGHLFGEYRNKPMAIKILPGKHMLDHGNVPAVGNIIDGHEIQKMLNDEKVRNSPLKTKNSRHSIRSPQIIRNPVAQKGRPNGPRTKLPHPKNQKTPYSQSNIEKAKITYTRQQNLKRNPTSKRQKFSDVFPGGPHTSNGFKPNFRPHPKDHNPNLDKSIKPQGGQDIPLFPHNKRPNEANLKQTSLQTPKSIKTSRGPVILGPKRPKKQILKIPLNQRPNLPQSSNSNLKNDFLRRPVRPHPSIKLSKTKNKRLPHLVRDGHKQKRIPRPRPTGYIRGGGRPNNVSPNTDIIEEILPSHATDDKNKIQFGFTPKIQNPFLRPGIVEDTNLTSHDYNPQERVEIIKGLIEPNSHKTIRPSPSSNDQLIATGYGVVVDGNNVRDMTITDSYGGVQIIQTKIQDRPYNLGNTALPLRPPPKVSKLDYQGWNTEQKDSVSVIRPTSSFSFQSSNKKEAPKTVTYANEWSVYRPDQKWTVRDTILRPSRTSKFTPPNTRGYNNEWSEVQPFNPNLYESIKSKNKLLQKNILSRHPFPNGGLQGEQPPHNLITEHQYIQATATNSANIIVASTLSPSTIVRDSNDESGFRGSNGNILSIFQETPKIPETPKKHEPLLSSTHEFQFVPNTTTPTQDTPHPVVEPATIKNEPGYLTTKRSIAKPSLWDKNPFITSSETLLPSIEQVVDTQIKKDKSTRLSPHIEPDTGTFVNIYPASTSSKIAESYNKATNNVEPGSGNFINTYPSVSTKTIPSRNPAEDKSDIENFKHLYPLPTTKREETSINTLSSSTSLNHPNPSLPHVEPNYYPGAYNGIVTSSPLKKVISTDLPPGIEPDTGTFINIFPASTSKTAFITEYHGYVDSDTIRRNENIKEAHEFGVKISPYDDQRQFENDYQQNFNIFYDNSGDPSYVYEDDNSGSSNSKSLHDSSEKSSYGQVDQINDTLISQPPALVIDLTGGPTIQNEHSNLHVESQHDPQQKNTLYTLHDTHKKGIPRNETYPTTNFNSEIIESKPQSPAKENQKRPVRKISQTLPGDKHNVNISNKNQLSTQKIDNLSQKNYFPTDKEDPKIDYSSHLVPISGFSDTKIEAKVPNASTTNIPIINDKNKSPDLNNQINFFENDPSDIFSEEITPLIENKDQDINLEVDNIRFTTNIPYTKDEIESQNFSNNTNTSTNTFNLDKKVPKEIDVENDVLQERVTIQKSNNTLVQQVTEGESLTAKTSVERNNDLDKNLHQSQQNTNIRPENLRPLIDDFYRNGNDRVKSNHRSVYLKDPKESLYVNSNEYGTNSGNYKNEYDYEEITKQFEAEESKLQSNNDQRSTFVYSSPQDGNRNNYYDQYDWIPTDSRYDNFPETPFYSNPDYFNERYDKNFYIDTEYDGDSNNFDKIIVTKLHSGLPSETKLNENDQYGNTENTGVPQFFGPTIPNFITTETTIDLDNRDDFSNTVDILDSFKDKNNSTLDYENPSNNINIKFNEASVENSNNNNSGVNELTKHANLQKGEGVLDSISIGLNDISLHDDKNNVNDSKHNGDTISTKDKSINTDSDVVVSSTESNGVIPGISNYDTEYPTGWDGQDNYYANYEDSNDGNILDVSRIEGAHGENTPVGSIKVEHTESPKYGNKDNSYGSNKYPVQKEDNKTKNSVDIAYIGSDSFRGSEPNQYQNGEVPPFGSEGNTHINELENEHHKSLDNKLNEVNEHIEALGNTSNEHNETHNNMLDALNSQNALLSEDSLSNTVNIVDESNKDPLENTENKVTIVESENDPRLSTIFAPKPQLLYPSVTVKDSNKPLVIIGPQVPNENLFPAPPHIIPSAIDKQRKPVVVYGPQENPNKHIQIHPSNNNPNPNFIGPLRFNPNFIGPFNIPENYENIPAAPGGFEFVGPVVHGPIIIGIPSSTLSSTTTTTAAVEEISSSPSSATTLKSENKVSSPIIEFKEIDEGRKIGSKYKINIRPSSRPILDVFKRRRSSTTTQSSSSLDTTTNDTPRGISFGGKYSPKYTIIRRSTTPSIVTARVPIQKDCRETKITFEGDSNSILQTDAPGVIRDQKLNNIDGAIVESIPGHSLSAEETDPETRCQNACGENELCKIKPGEGVVCKCRPGFGRVEGSSTKCEKSKSFAIEVIINTSESEEIKIVKLSPKEVEKAVADSYRKNIKELYFGSQITSIKVGNNTKRNIFFGGEKNLTHDDEMSFSMIVHIADDGKNSTEERLKSVLETPIKDTKLPLGADVTVSRVTIEDFDECTHKDHNDCSDQAVCHNIKGSYTCICKEGYHDLSGPEILSGRVCLATTTACDLCNGNGNCIAGETVTCECQSWFAGKNCQINMKLLLIVGCVSVGLMLVIACGVSCFCCKDGRGAAIRSKQNIPSPYGTGIGPMPPMRGHGVLMDPHGTMKSRAFVPRPYAIRPKRSKKSSAEGSSYNGSTSGGGSWQATYNGISGADSTTSKQSRKSGGLSSGIEALNPAVLIPRAKVKSKPFEDFLSEDEASSSPEANRALSEHTSLASRHRRRSIPFIIRSSRSEPNRTLRGNTLRSVASETFEVPVMRTNTQITSGSISVRSLRSHATSDGGRTMAERDGGSSFVISASRSHQLYRLHDSDGSLDSL
ncbi:unnamed protein product [Lepeophtheirus salmonis]|uniref:(salmon louse) hypothetical protein n=1 Tax=Lepeophtheirus salmonis TaxID=72036 RepID=A0A7R8CDK6_LEPSM|nr:unnamed protein product [Lepeophtheirus salmonis]CAF2750259.1 unnamed protein product [Lepeophtheirus salmonis]